MRSYGCTMGVLLEKRCWLLVIMFYGKSHPWNTLHIISCGIRRIFLAHTSVKKMRLV